MTDVKIIATMITVVDTPTKIKFEGSNKFNCPSQKGEIKILDIIHYAY